MLGKAHLRKNSFKSAKGRSIKNVEYYINLPYEIIVKKLSKDECGGYLARYRLSFGYGRRRERGRSNSGRKKGF